MNQKLYFLNDSVPESPPPSERERQLEAGIWSLVFLNAELSNGIRHLRDILVFKGVLTPEEDERVSQITGMPENARKAYEVTEVAFRQRYGHCRLNLEDPEKVREMMRVDEERLKEAEASAATGSVNVGTTAAGIEPGITK